MTRFFAALTMAAALVLVPHDGVAAGRKFIPTEPIDVAKRLCAKVFSGQPFVYAMIFAEEFRNAVTEERMIAISKDVVATAGTCARADLLGKKLKHGGDETEADAVLTSTLGNQVTIHFAFDEDGFVTELLIKDIAFPSVALRTWTDVSQALTRLPGRTSLTAGAFDARPIGIRATEVQPMGSTFKLYVLKALEEAVLAGRRRWTEIFPIREDWKSFGGAGQMHEAPAGRAFSVAQYAEAMISVSDNTATDHLIRLLGRAEVEKAVSLALHHEPALLHPFLLTQEFFKLKWAAPTATAVGYIRAKPEQKVLMLDREIAALPREAFGRNGVPMDRPTLIRQIEWFGTTVDQCRAMQSLVARRDPTILRILSRNVPLVSGSNWLYAGYKGGSEPGVMSMTYVFLDRGNRWQCLSATWSNESAPVNEWVFMDIVRKSIRILEVQAP